MLDQRTREVVARLGELYAAGTDYESKKANRPEVNRLWGYLTQVTPEAGFDDLLHIINITREPTGHTLKLTRRALRLCESLEQVRVIIPLLPASWTEERSFLLRKIVELIDDKEELLRVLRETGFIA